MHHIQLTDSERAFVIAVMTAYRRDLDSAPRTAPDHIVFKIVDSALRAVTYSTKSAA